MDPLVPEHVEHSSGGTSAKILSKQEANQLGKVAEKLLETSDLEQALRGVDNANSINLIWVVLNGKLRIKDNLVSIATMGMVDWARVVLQISASDSGTIQSARSALTAEDLAKARELAGHAKRAHGKIYLTLKNRSYLVNAIIKYIEESTKQRAASGK